MVVHVGITGQVGRGAADLDTDFLASELDTPQVSGGHSLICGVVPLPAAELALDGNTKTRDGKAVDEFDGQVLVEDENVGEVAVAEYGVDFPQFAVSARYHRAGFNQL